MPVRSLPMTTRRATLLSFLSKLLLYGMIAANGYCLYTAWMYGRVLTFDVL